MHLECFWWSAAFAWSCGYYYYYYYYYYEQGKAKGVACQNSQDALKLHLRNAGFAKENKMLLSSQP